MAHEHDDRIARRQIAPARRLTLAHERGDAHVRCADCDTPAFRAFGDHVALRGWILEYRKPLAAELRDYFRKNPELHARPDHWFGLLTAQLRGEVALAWEQSELAAVHGIPPELVTAFAADGATLAERLRAFVSDGFVALVCGRCRAPHNRPALTPNAIRRRYAKWFFDGDLRAAELADPLRWRLLGEAIAACLETRAIASEG